jgi:hypothetical protein
MSTPPVVGAHLDHLVPGHRHGGGVGAVRRIGCEHLVPVLAAILVIGPGEQQAGQLAVRPRAGLQGDVRKAGDLAQRALEAVHQLERALRVLGILQRVQAGVAR